MSSSPQQSPPENGTRGRFVLVACGASKADERREARNLYTSNYFAVKRRYAEAATAWAGQYQSNAWAILSAEHAVLPSSLEIEPYDTSVDDLDDQALDEWADQVRGRLTTWLYHPFRSDNDPTDTPCKQLEVLAGESYLEPLEERNVFEEFGPQRKAAVSIPVRSPFREAECSGIGEQMQWLSERTAEMGPTGPARRQELSSFDGGIERERALWAVDRPEIDIEGTEQAGLDAFEDVPDQYVATEQRRLDVLADGGESDV